MQSSKAIIHVFIIVSFFIENIYPHAGMKYPPPRPTLKNYIPDDDSIIQRIRANGDPVYIDGQVIYKNYPCGNSKPNEDKFMLEKGKTLPVEIFHTNQHEGGHCQFSISYDDTKTFVAFHQILNDCLTGGPGIGRTTLDVPIPNDLPGGNAVFAWTWITKKSLQPEYYMSCSDVIIDGPTVGKVTGYPLIVANIEFKGPYLKIFSGYPEYPFLFQKKPVLEMSVEGNKIKLNNEVFTPTRHLKENDPLFEEFEKSSSSMKSENSQVKATKPTISIKKPEEDIKKPEEDIKKPEEDIKIPVEGINKPVEGTKHQEKDTKKPSEEIIIPQETVRNAIKYVSNMPEPLNWCHGKFFSKK
ncbi:hypothetical protein HMI54_014726 [Coelomomyces lativittatus]|nr:hypothetical protein HMI55_001746 [Coelomomyces lativittatus]KAJ1507575.1 hypothetical protein HMI56_007716 [Coelomomyces lativittatus]KAJ1513739.1 hypothetical protein HMI54_014726 [Coelomomyces lativittatus]